MSVPTPPALDGGTWAPERELMESAPRRYAPSPYPDMNQPNAPVLLGLGGLLLVVGLILFFVASNNATGVSDMPYILGGVLFAIGGAAMVAVYPTKMKQHRDRAANLIENGAPFMARIVKVDNSTGDSEFGRIVTYMITLPGANEETRREVKVDDRALPKRIPGPVTALIDFRSSDVELYCALPFVAVSKFAQAAAPAEQQTPLPTKAAEMPAITTPVSTQSQSQTQSAPTGGMSPLTGMGTAPVAPPPTPAETEAAKPRETKRPAPGGAAKLPWET